MASYNLIPSPVFPALHASLMEFSEALALALPYKSNAIRQRRIACPAGCSRPPQDSPLQAITTWHTTPKFFPVTGWGACTAVRSNHLVTEGAKGVVGAPCGGGSGGVCDENRPKRGKSLMR